MLLLNNSWQEVSILFTVWISLFIPAAVLPAVALVAHNCKRISWPFSKETLWMVYPSTKHLYFWWRYETWRKESSLRWNKRNYVFFQRKHIEEMTIDRLGGMWSSLPTAPCDYCQDHESTPNNVVGNAVIPTCNAGHLLFVQPGIWRTYCISKDSQVWITSTKIAVKLC